MVKDAVSRGSSQRAIARIMNVSQTTVSNARFGMLDKRIDEKRRFVPDTVTKDTLRAHDILHRWDILNQRQDFRKAKKDLKRVQHYLSEHPNGNM